MDMCSDVNIWAVQYECTSKHGRLFYFISGNATRQGSKFVPDLETQTLMLFLF